MKDDYLWDKSGEPDPEIQQLEEILGTLRYRPRPLELPRDLRPHRRRNYFPALAIAATVMLSLLAGIIWLRARTDNVPQQQQAHAPVLPPPSEEKAIPKAEPKRDLVAVNPTTPREQNVAVNNNRRNRSSAPGLRKREREEALAAKEQVLLALRLASEKLNLAHRKTQNPSANQIKNQHRIG
jgi:hypothetical protein